MAEMPKVSLAGLATPNPGLWDPYDFDMNNGIIDQRLESRCFYACQFKIPSEKGFIIKVAPQNFSKDDIYPDLDLYVYQRYEFTDNKEVIWLPFKAEASTSVKAEIVIHKMKINRHMAVLIYFYDDNKYKSANCRIEYFWG